MHPSWQGGGHQMLWGVQNQLTACSGVAEIGEQLAAAQLGVEDCYGPVPRSLPHLHSHYASDQVFVYQVFVSSGTSIGCVLLSSGCTGVGQARLHYMCWSLTCTLA